MKNIFLFLVICCIIYSCNEPIVKYSKLNKQKTIEQGEWISNLDSLSGISIRENKIAFFKNMEIINKNDSSLTLKTDKNKSEIFKYKASKK